MMNATRKITRVKLDISQDNDSLLIGIVSADPDYKLTLSINRKLQVRLKQIEPLVVPGKTGKETEFSRFSYSSDNSCLIYDLISNRSEKNFLIGKLKNIDYILHIHDPDNETDTEELISQLRDTESVTAVFILPPASLRDKNLHYISR